MGVREARSAPQAPLGARARLPANALTRAPLQAMQRGAGNRAMGRMLSRLAHDRRANELFVPPAYASQPVAWNATTGYLEQRAARSGDPTLQAIVNDGKRGPAVKRHLATGMRLPAIDRLIVATADSRADVLAGQHDDDADVKRAIRAEFDSHHRVLVHGTDQRYWSPEEVASASHWILSAADCLPQEPDLPAAGKPLKTTRIPGAKFKEATYWSFVCVLIALIKDGGLGRARDLIRQPQLTEQAAVQEVSDHYITQGVQYDDTSTRFRVMGDFGYSLVYSGSAAWADLAQHTSLDARRYIFDITGHTLMVNVKQAIPQVANGRLAPLNAYFEPISDPANYTEDPFTKTVSYIWAK